MTRARPLAILLLSLAFAAASIVTPFGGFGPEQLRIPQPDPPAQPPGWAFSIWGAIYLWLILSAAWGFSRRPDDPDWRRARPPLAAALLLGVPWLWLARQGAIPATVDIFLMAGFAIAALRRAPLRDRWTFRAPVGLFAGWLTAASFVSLSVAAPGYGLPLTPLAWGWIAVTGALAVALWVVLTAPVPLWGYGLGVGWALTGIVITNGPASALGLFAFAGALAIGAGLLWRLRLSRGASAGARVASGSSVP